MQAIATVCANLTSLRLPKCKRLNDTAVAEIALKNPFLSHLDLSGNRRMTDKAITTTAESCTSSLRYLNLTLCTRLTDKALICVSINCSALFYLNLRSCRNFTDKAIVGIAMGCPNLRRINCSGCDALSDVAVVALVKHCPLLAHVDLSYCKRISDRSIQALATATHLTYLKLHKCTKGGNITDVEIIKIARKFAAFTGMTVVQCLASFMQPPSHNSGNEDEELC